MAATVDQYTSRATLLAASPTAGTIASLRSLDVTGSRTLSLWIFLTDGGWMMLGEPIPDARIG